MRVGIGVVIYISNDFSGGRVGPGITGATQAAVFGINQSKAVFFRNRVGAIL